MAQGQTNRAGQPLTVAILCSPVKMRALCRSDGRGTGPVVSALLIIITIIIIGPVVFACFSDTRPNGSCSASCPPFRLLTSLQYNRRVDGATRQLDHERQAKPFASQRAVSPDRDREKQAMTDRPCHVLQMSCVPADPVK